jgi:hypothetical protein
MKKYISNKIQYLKKMVKLYLHNIDRIVFLISILCLFWMFLYKLYLIDKEPFFDNANTFAEIIYTAFSSIVATGLFYFFTIFIPRCYQVNGMKKHLPARLSKIDLISISIISQVNNSHTNEKYTQTTFHNYLITENPLLDEDFIAYYSIQDNKKELEKSVIFQHILLENILVNYSNLLPQDYIQLLTDLCDMTFKLAKIVPNSEDGDSISSYFELFVQISYHSKIIKNYINNK